mgnify:CR=1 FL=1
MEVMRIIGFILIINALSIIPRTIFVRNVNFKTQTKVSLISSISSGFVGIGMELGRSTTIPAIIEYFIFMDFL